MECVPSRTCSNTKREGGRGGREGKCGQEREREKKEGGREGRREKEEEGERWRKGSEGGKEGRKGEGKIEIRETDIQEEKGECVCSNPAQVHVCIPDDMAALRQVRRALLVTRCLHCLSVRWQC